MLLFHYYYYHQYISFLLLCSVLVNYYFFALYFLISYYTFKFFFSRSAFFTLFLSSSFLFHSISYRNISFSFFSVLLQVTLLILGLLESVERADNQPIRTRNCSSWLPSLTTNYSLYPLYIYSLFSILNFLISV